MNVAAEETIDTIYILSNGFTLLHYDAPLETL